MLAKAQNMFRNCVIFALISNHDIDVFITEYKVRSKKNVLLNCGYYCIYNNIHANH